MANRLQWHRGPEDGPYGSPSSLAPYAGRDAIIEVLPHQMALIIRRHEVRAALLPNLHRLLVRRPAAGASNGAAGTAVVREVCDEDILVFVDLGSFTIPLGGPPRDSSPAWKGQAHLRVTDARRFYESFLRHSEDLPPAQFQTICGRLLGSIHPASLTTPASQDTLFARIGVKLRGVGLLLERLELTFQGETPQAESTVTMATSAAKL